MDRRSLTQEEARTASRVKTTWLAKKGTLHHTQSTAAKKLGISQSAFNQFINAKIPIPADMLMQFSLLLQEPVELFSERVARNVYAVNNLKLKKRTLPVMLALRQSDHPIKHIVTITEPELQKESNLYLVFVDTDEYRPYVRANEYIIVNPIVPPKKNDRVFVMTKDNQRIIAERGSRTALETALIDIRTGLPTVYKNEDIELIHRIEGTHV